MSLCFAVACRTFMRPSQGVNPDLIVPDEPLLESIHISAILTSIRELGLLIERTVDSCVSRHADNVMLAGVESHELLRNSVFSPHLENGDCVAIHGPTIV